MKKVSFPDQALPEDLRSLLAEAGSRNYRYLVEIARLGVEQGIFKPCDPRTLAEALFSSFLGIVHLENSKASMGRKTHVDSTMDLAFRILREGVLNKQPGETGP